MKKLLHIKLFVLLGVLHAGTNAWADVVVTLDNIGAGLSTTANTTAATTNITATGTSDSYTLNYYQCKKQGNSMFMTKSVSPYISNKTAMPGNIKSVEVFINSGAAGKTTYNCAFSDTECNSASAATGVGAVNITGGNSHVFTANVQGKYFLITLGNANNGQVLKLVITCEDDDDTPVINASDPAKLAYTAGSGSISYSITNGSSNVTASSSETWLTIGTITGSEVPFTVTQNDGSADRTATVTLSYTGATDKTVTVTQGYQFVATDGVFDFTTGADYGSGISPKNNATYGSTYETTDGIWTAGNITLSTTAEHYRYWDTGSATQLRVYNGGTFTLAAPNGYEITQIDFAGTNLGNIAASDGTYSSGTWTGNAQSVEFTASGTTNINTITVTYSAAAALTTLYIKTGDASWNPYIWAWKGSTNFTGGDWNNKPQATTTETLYGVLWHKYEVASDDFDLILSDGQGSTGSQTTDITGITGGGNKFFVYNSATADNVSNTQYMIITDPTVVPVSANNVNVEAGSTVNAVVTNTHGMTLSYASGDTSVATVDASTGVATGVAAGTATITVSWGTGWDVANNGTGFLAGSITYDVTVTAPVVDYATLPFTFTGGKADIANTNGLTQSGITGNDYGNLAKLRFDDSGDELVLKFNSEPGVLTYNIKGNGTPSTTPQFDVMQSADGNTWSVVKTYDSFNTTDTDGAAETINTLASTTRFIKWVFTTKGSGQNVGLGNIHLAVPVVSPYTVTAASNNTSYGTVAESNLVITATPAAGYRVSTTTPYTVSPSDAATVTDNGNGTYTVSNVTANCTVTINFEAIPTYEVTITAPTNGTLVVKNAGTAIASGDMIEEGTELTIEATPAAGYNFQNWQANDGSIHTYTTNFTWTVNAAVTISASFVEKVYHNANFYVNGAKTTVEVEEGQSITFPVDPAAIGTKTFQGWYGDHYTSATTAPVYVDKNNQTMGNTDVNFYAVFATGSGSGGTYSITHDDIVNYGTSGHSAYSNDYSLNGFTGRWLINNSSGHLSLQLGYNTDTSKTAYNSHLATPVCSSPITSVTVETTVAGKTLYLCDSNDKGVASSGTYGSGTTALVEEINTTTINVTGNPTQIYIYPSATTNINSISVSYGSSTTDFCTEIPVTFTIGNDVGAAAKVLDRDIDAYATAQGVDDENWGIYKVQSFTNREATLVKLGANDTGTSGSERYIPAGTPVIIFVPDHNENYDLVPASADAQEIEDNILQIGHSAYPGTGTYYVLQKPKNRDLGFYKLGSGRSSYPETFVYLDSTIRGTSSGSSAPRKTMYVENDDVTGIDGINNDANAFADGKWYNLQGIEVKKPSKGIYLHNGKKVVLK